MPSRDQVVREAHWIIARYYLGRATAEEAVEWAVMALEAGLDGPQMSMLAASTKPINWFETLHYLQQALNEVGVSWLDREEAIWNAARDAARGILDGSLDPEEGVHQLVLIAIALEYPERLMEFYMLDDELDLRYGPDAVEPAQWKTAAESAARRFLAPN